MTAGRFSAWAGARRSRRHGRITADSFVRISTPRDQPMNNGFALIAYENRRPVRSRVRRSRSSNNGGFNRGRRSASAFTALTARPRSRSISGVPHVPEFVRVFFGVDKRLRRYCEGRSAGVPRWSVFDRTDQTTRGPARASGGAAGTICLLTRQECYRVGARRQSWMSLKTGGIQHWD
jgi:hypothetical protein